MAKHIVYVPGAWHGPFYMDKVNKELESRGYTIHAGQVPSIGSNPPPKDLSEDIAFIQSLVEEAIGSEGNDVAVICHSWGGIVAGSALTGYGKEARAKAGKKGGIVRVGYMAAFLADEGVCLMDNMPAGQPLPWWDIQGDVVYATDPKIFYGDLPEAEQQEWFSKLQSHNFNSFSTKATGAAWKEIPTSYLICEDDMAIPMQAQEGMIQFAKSKGVEVDVERLKASHSPFLSMPKETADWIVKVAGGK